MQRTSARYSVQTGACTVDYDCTMPYAALNAVGPSFDYDGAVAYYPGLLSGSGLWIQARERDFHGYTRAGCHTS